MLGHILSVIILFSEIHLLTKYLGKEAAVRYFAQLAFSLLMVLSIRDHCKEQYTLTLKMHNCSQSIIENCVSVCILCWKVHHTPHQSLVDALDQCWDCGSQGFWMQCLTKPQAQRPFPHAHLGFNSQLHQLRLAQMGWFRLVSHSQHSACQACGHRSGHAKPSHMWIICNKCGKHGAVWPNV